ncbi:Uncharacterized protein SCF082_LOCUS8262 [Durusdinium trenchii]|uniref:Domain of unknown function at the cortex 1 domain-containing protein n=1 Tax=Durusdinium trenchii TaxID=1381693 RepID=A0ABP0IPW7_9DINO
MDHADKMVADSDAASTADSDAASTAASGESWWATEWISTASAGALDLASAGGDVLLASAGVIGFGFTSAWEYLTDTGFRQKSMKPLLAEPSAEPESNQCDETGATEVPGVMESTSRSGKILKRFEKNRDNCDEAESCDEDELDEPTEDEPQGTAAANWWKEWLSCFAGCGVWSASTPVEVEAPDGTDTSLVNKQSRMKCHGFMQENEYFRGQMLMMHRTTEQNTAPTTPYAQYFAKKTRRWELRLQGQFRRSPGGKLYMGVVLRDFDYSQPLSTFIHWLSTLSLTPLEYITGSKVMLSFGDREEAAMKDDAMFAQLVSGLQAFDQIIVTSPGEVPPIHADLDNLGITRLNLCTVLFCAKRAQITDILPVFPAVSLSSILDRWPPHFVLYALEEPQETGESCSPPLHLERNKEYIFDLMMVPKCKESLHLSQRYYFPKDR